MPQKLKILILEDVVEDAELIEHALKKAGFSFDLLVTNTKSEFINGLRDFEPNLVLSDHSLPQFNSAEALHLYKRRLKAQHRFAPFILVTGTVSEAFAAQCIKEGAADYILKDQLHLLPQAITNALRKCSVENKSQDKNNLAKLLLKKYEYAAHIAGIAVWDWDIIKKTTHCDSGFETVFGHRSLPGVCINNLNTAFISADDIERVVTSLERTLESAATTWCEQYRYLKADGEYTLVEDKAIVLRSIDGVAFRVIGVMTALGIVTTKNTRLQILQPAVERMTHSVFIAECADDASALKIVHVNHVLRQITGYTDAELLGSSPRIFSGSKTSVTSIARLTAALRKKQPCQLEIIGYKKDQTQFLAKLVCMPVTIADNSESAYWLFIETGISTNREYVGATENQTLQLKNVAYMQSHLIRPPLARLMGFINLIKFKPKAEIEMGLLLNYVLDAASELDIVIRQIVAETEKKYAADEN